MADKITMFGKLLTGVQKTRKFARDRAVDDLYRRNKIDPSRPGYRLAETNTIQQDGTEVTEYRLYKLIDCSVVTIRTEVEATTQTGLDSIVRERR